MTEPSTTIRFDFEKSPILKGALFCQGEFVQDLDWIESKVNLKVSMYVENSNKLQLLFSSARNIRYILEIEPCGLDSSMYSKCGGNLIKKKTRN